MSSSVTSTDSILSSIELPPPYHRIDVDIPEKFQKMFEKSAVHKTLKNTYSCLERYDIYRNGDKKEVAAVIAIGENLCGHPGIVHGGIISTLFDNTFGWLFTTLEIPPAFTANLSINYRKPVLENCEAVIYSRVKEIDGRKLYFEATWEKDGVVYADATALFIQPRVKE